MVFCQPLGCLLLTFLLSALYFPINHAQLKKTVEVKVTIPQGTVVGTTLTTRKGRNISAFLGIPFAEPPIGNLRFANPVAAGGWNGVLNASLEASMCVQPGPNGTVGKEDCLYVKVYTPQLAEHANSSLLPVMVYIHGGGFLVESPPFNGPNYLLDADVVLVTLNYRLGALGFLSTGDEVASGNWALKDQVLALKWVRHNVRYFGGDPDQVTLFGESAGAASVHLLTLSNATNGLFHRYITQSGSALGTWAHRPRAAYSSRAFEFGEYVGCFNDTSSSLISCLRTLNTADIVTRAAKFLLRETIVAMIWGPTDELDVEGAVLTDSPTNLFAAGKVRDLPWMSGVVRDEGLLMTAEYYKDQVNLPALLAKIDTVLPIMLDWTYQPDGGAAWTSAVKSYYFNNDLTGDPSQLLENLTLLIGDSHFYYPARNALLQHHAVSVNPQYFYTFNYRGTYSISNMVTGSVASFGVAHADDLIYLFPKDSLFSHFKETMSEIDYRMVDTMVHLWTNFAINGTPSTSAMSWAPYSAEDKYLRIGNDSGVALEMQSSFLPERMQFWANIDDVAKNSSGATSSAFA